MSVVRNLSDAINRDGLSLYLIAAGCFALDGYVERAGGSTTRVTSDLGTGRSVMAKVTCA